MYKKSITPKRGETHFFYDFEAYSCLSQFPIDGFEAHHREVSSWDTYLDGYCDKWWLQSRLWNLDDYFSQ